MFCPNCDGDVMGYMKHIMADGTGTYFRCRWCGAKIYQQNGFSGYVDDDGNPKEDDYDPMLSPVDPELYDNQKKLVKSSGKTKVQKELIPNTKQKEKKVPKVPASINWDNKGFDYDKGHSMDPPHPLYPGAEA